MAERKLEAMRAEMDRLQAEWDRIGKMARENLDVVDKLYCEIHRAEREVRRGLKRK
jgi:hypothetical protein